MTIMMRARSLYSHCGGVYLSKPFWIRGSDQSAHNVHGYNRVTLVRLIISSPLNSPGMMGLWCRHGCSLGFHVLKSSEGRNDVFSAILCHFEQAPEIIIYDFACSLAPYALTRELQFFKNTKFLIDQLHAHGHTRCSPSSFVRTFMKVNPALKTINDAAAECGNSGLRKISKSVAYMRQERAVEFIATYLYLWNRKKRLSDKALDRELARQLMQQRSFEAAGALEEEEEEEEQPRKEE